MYEIIKPFTVRDIISRTDVCHRSVIILVNNLNLDYKYTNDLNDEFLLCKDFDQDFGGVNGLKWLEMNGYIKKKDEIFYKRGQIFKFEDSENIYIKYVLAVVDYTKINLIAFEGMVDGERVLVGKRWNKDNIKIKDHNKITQEEFTELCGSHYVKSFKLIGE